MSINAHRIRNNNLDIERASFDIGHDEKLIDFINKEILFCMSLNSYGTGIVDVPVELLEKAVDAPKKYDLNDDTVSRLQSDIAHAKSSKEEIVTYYCF